MRRTEVGDVWGIGRKTSARLHEGGIHTVFDLIQADVTALRRQFSVVMEKTLRELRGVSCLDVEDAAGGQPADPVLAFVRRTGHRLADADRGGEPVRVARGGEAAPSAQRGRAVQVFIATSPYRQHDRQHPPTATLPLTRPSQDTAALVSAAVRALQSIHRPGFNYLKAGVMLIDLQPQHQAAQATLELFADEPAPPPPPRDRARLMSAIDTLNQRFGRGAVNVASATPHAARGGSHASRQDLRSPRYTTRLDEVITARA